MTTVELLFYLRNLGVKLWVEGDRLRYSSPEGALTPDLRAELVRRKAEIIAFLCEAETVVHSGSRPLLPVPRDETLPLSFAQQRMWILNQLAPGDSRYNIPLAIRIRGRLQVAALQESLREIVRRHEVLRTTFPSIDGRPSQVISQDGSPALPLIDLRALSESDREAQARRLAAEEAGWPFDLAQGPLLRTGLLRLGAEDHVLLLVMHHIISDGWSIGVLMEEFATLYQAFTRGERSPLPELPVQYADFAYWEKQWLQGEVLARQLSYWRQRLQGSPPVLELPTDRPRPRVQTFHGALKSLALPQGLVQALKDLSHREEVTLFMTLIAAFQTLLYRYTGQEDIVVGCPIANRTHPETERIIGLFVNTLVMRTDFSGDLGFRDLLRQVRETALGAYAHQDLPFEYLVDELKPERNPSYTPLFQVAFQLQNAWRVEFDLPGLMLSRLEVKSETAKFDLALSMVPVGEDADRLSGSLEYNTDLFDDATITRMLAAFQTLLASIVANPEQRVSSLPIMSGAEQRQLLLEWNDTSADYPKGRCVQELFEVQVEQRYDSIAVCFEGEQLSYGQLNQQANQLAHYLRRLGVGPEVVIGICVERSLEMIVGLLGVLKAGGAYLPMDPAYPREGLAFMLEDARLPILLTQKSLLERLPQGNTRVICLDRDWKVISRERSENPPHENTAENLAYVIYTSGSTGKPKGVAIQHAGLVNLITWHQQTYGVKPADRATQLAGVAFDASVWELWPYLTAGASIHIPNEETRASISQLIEWLATEAITLCFLPTPLAEAALNEPWPHQAALRALLTGGDKLHRGPRSDLPFTLVNHYGPTEYTVVTTWTPLAAEHKAGVAPPIGRPLPNTKIYLLNTGLQPAPIGVPGELCIGGDGLARGYLNRPELSAERFVPDPFSGEPGARLYKTGDLARYLPDGHLEFLGRIDHQVKVRGFRIELGEIEAVLHEHPAIREAVVEARDGMFGDKRLVAYLVASQEPAPAISELSAFLQEKLPKYMAPAAYVWLDALPLTPNGKVDRGALPEPDQSRPELDTAFIAPRTKREQVLAEIWGWVLGVNQVGIRDNFFELGGDSMRIIQIVARANQAGLQLVPSQLFHYPTIEGLAEVADTATAARAEQGIVTGPVPLTSIQRFFFERQLIDPHHWNWAFLREAPQRLDAALLEQTFKHLLAHHDALRLRFHQTESGWEQFNAGLDGSVPLTFSDLSALAPEEQTAAIESAAAALQGSLNLSTGPLMRIAYFALGEERPDRLLLIFHHLVVDVVSIRILMEDFQTGYQQLSRGEAVQLPPKTTSFQDWSRRLAEYAQSDALRRELSYWAEAVSGEVPALPRDYPAGENDEASAEMILTELGAGETRALLHEIPAATGAQMQEALLTALGRAFALWTGQPRLLVEVEGHGREEILEGVDHSRTVGWFTSIYPVLLDLSQAVWPDEALRIVHAQLHRIPKRGIGFGLLRYLCEDRAVRDRMRALPRAEVNFNYLGQLDQRESPGGSFRPARESKGPERSLRGRRNYPLYVVGSVRSRALRMHWNYSANLHKRATIENLASSFNEQLRSLIAHCLSREASGYTSGDGGRRENRIYAS